ncbi:MAG: ClpXP protease specificity-enhancing factor [Pseudomonadota bacterium]|nr:ClpXP protease specificity-enhancing factor [Pseudomonadota bacterium]
MLPRKPYLIRAIYHWLMDSQYTPYLAVDTRVPGCQVPMEYVKDNQIVFNISPLVVDDFQWDNDIIQFSARFSGIPRNIMVPVSAVLALVSKENGEGMTFDIDIDALKAEAALKEQPASEKKNPKAHLKVVK